MHILVTVDALDGSEFASRGLLHARADLGNAPSVITLDL